jgi:putative LysE/RhtB family amino acid efflux pump
MGFLVVCLAGFFVALSGSIPMAGPVAVLVLARTTQRKFDEALRIAIGSALAEGCFAALAFWGIATFLARHESLVPIAHGVTAFVFVSLGVRFMVWTPPRKKKEKRQRRKTGPMFEGFAFTAINPTLLLTWSAATTLLWAHGVMKQQQSPWLTIPYGIFAAAGVAAWWVFVTKLVREHQDLFDRKTLMWIVRALGLVLVGLGVWSGVELVVHYHAL